MTIKELQKYFFADSTVKIRRNNNTLFCGFVKELPYCPYADDEVKENSICTISAGIIQIGITNSIDKIPEEFDSYEVPNRIADRMIKERIPVHVKILGSITHHYTQEKYYNIAITSMGLFNFPEIKTEFISETKLKEFYEFGKEE